MTRSLLDCASCGTRTWLALTSEQTAQLQTVGYADAFCERCARTTPWSPATVQGGSGAPVGAPKGAPAKGGAGRPGDKRTHRRAPVRLPVRIRGERHGAAFEDFARTVDASRDGIYFESTQPYTRGLACRVALNYHDPVASQMEQPGRVVRVEKHRGSDVFGIAISFEKP